METVRRALHAAFQRGWLPEDLCALAARQADRAVAAGLRALVADRAVAHPVAVKLLGLLTSLPRLPPLPLRPPSVEVDEKMLARVRALLAKAESTTFPDEAEALSAKAQELMTRHAFDRALVESAPGGQSASARRIWLDNPYLSAKALLVQSVAKANRCRTTFYPNPGFVTVLGNEVDLRAVELLSTSLLVQATKAMVANGSRVSYAGQSRTRSYRQAFLVAYAERIGERLRGVTEASVAAESERDRLLPVLAARRKAVDDLFAAMFPNVRSSKVSVTNGAGWTDGRAAADLAVLNSGPRIGNAPSRTVP